MIFRHQSYHGNVMMPLRFYLALHSRFPAFFSKSLDPFTARVDDGVCEVVLTLGLWTKSYGVTIQMKSLRKYFHVVLFVLKKITK